MATFSPRPTEFEFPWFDTRNTYDQSLETAINDVEALVIAPTAEMVNAAIDTPEVTENIARKTAAEVREVAAAGTVGVGWDFPATEVTGPTLLEYFDGKLWGVEGSSIKTSEDGGVIWSTVATAPADSLSGLMKTFDGEMLGLTASKVYRSVGWKTGPATATWVEKVSKSMPTGAGFLRWGFDGDGTKFILTEYSGGTVENRNESRYVWISVDEGKTWAIAYDKLVDDPTNTSHMHGACYDPWEDRFWFAQGHGVVMGTYFSDDDGISWTKLGGAFQPDAAPTVLLATDDGIVCGSDSGDGGAYGIPRAPKDKLEMVRTVRWQTIDQAGVAGFATRAYRDPRSGLVYLGFKSDHANVSAMITASTARSGAVLWEAETPEGCRTAVPFVTNTGALIAEFQYFDSTRRQLTGHVNGVGQNTFDDGNTGGGYAEMFSGFAIGKGAKSSSRHSMSIGHGATSGGSDGGIALGQGALSGSRSVSIGKGAAVTGVHSDSIAIGDNVSVSATNAVAIGSGATVFANATNAVAIGKGSQAAPGGTALGAGALAGTDVGRARATAIGFGSSAGTDSVSIGNASLSGTSQIAIGKGATAAAGVNGIALGNGTTTTAADQLAIGARHQLILNAPAIPVTPANGGVLYVEDGALKYKGSSGTITVIALA